ncbi:response regulator transcription factor [bacterium]|nr:response regulator transcription factor [bacterium]
MTATHAPGRGRPAGPPLDAVLSAMLGRRVRGLSVEVREGRLYLRGRADSYHVKQLAQHAAMAVTELPLAANQIEVSGPRRRVVLASGDDRVRAGGRAHLAALGWDVTTAHGGLECVARLRRSAWDVAVLDADLLGGGADGVLADIAGGASPDLPVVLLGTPPRVRADGSGARVVAVLEKPVDLGHLARAAAAAAGGRVAAAEGR